MAAQFLNGPSSLDLLKEPDNLFCAESTFLSFRHASFGWWTSLTSDWYGWQRQVRPTRRPWRRCHKSCRSSRMTRHPCKVTTELPPHAGNAAGKATLIQKGENPVESRAYFSALAEREGFEPSVGLRLRLISSQVHSTTLPPFRGVRCYSLHRSLQACELSWSRKANKYIRHAARSGSVLPCRAGAPGECRYPRQRVGSFRGLPRACDQLPGRNR